MAILIQQSDTPTAGELRVMRNLERALPPDWFVIGNLPLVRRRVDREIDVVVIGDRGVWGIDEKSYTGTITGDKHTWIRADGSSEHSLVGKALYAAKLLKGEIKEYCPSLAAVWVEGLVVLSAESVDIRVEDPRLGTTIIKLEHLVQRLTSPATTRGHRSSVLDAEQ